MLRQVDIDSLMNQVRTELLGSSDAIIKAMFFQVATEFLNDTSLWTETIQITATVNKRHYDLTPDGGQIVRLDGVLQIGDGAAVTPGDTPGVFPVPALMPEIPTLIANHAPNTTQTWHAVVTKNVDQPILKNGFPIAPEWLLQRWFLAMKHGIIGELANQQDKSWSNAKSALYHLSKFRKYVQDGRVIKLKANTAGATAWRFPQGYNSRSQQGGVPSFGGRERTF